MISSYIYLMKKLLFVVVSSASVLVIAFGLFLTGFYGWRHTDSMNPTFMDGDFTYTNPFQTPKVGDIIQYRCHSRTKCPTTYDWLISHRLTAIKPDGCMVIIGDNPKYDWSHVYCYMPDEIVIRGVSHKL